MIDLLIRNARIVDGTGSPWFRGDVAVRDGRIAALGRLGDMPAREVIDAGDQVLAPGFIDIHGHSDFTLPAHRLAESRILQGVTTELNGNCGISPFPINPDTVTDLRKYAAFLSNDLSYDWAAPDDYFAMLAAEGVSTNFATLVGHGSLRIAAMGFDARKPTAAEMERMKLDLRRSLHAGALGMSCGLVYPPGIFSASDELVELAAELKDYGGLFEIHMRDESDDVLAAIDEAIGVGRAAGVPVEIAHLKVSGRKNHGRYTEPVIARIAAARAAGVDVTADQYPYTAGATTLTSNLPGWALEGGVDGMLTRLRDSAQRRRIEDEVTAAMAQRLARWEDIFISQVATAKNAWVAGKNLQEIADAQGKSPVMAMIDLLLEEDGSVAIVSFSISEDDMQAIMTQPFVVIGSDGCAAPLDSKSMPHPRFYGTFPRVIAVYSRDRGLLSLEQAVHKMTGQTAARLRLSDRGLIKTGMWADLVLFDVDALCDTPTYQAPKAACAGISRVWVNGVLTAKDGVHTGALAGKLVKNRAGQVVTCC